MVSEAQRSAVLETLRSVYKPIDAEDLALCAGLWNRQEIEAGDVKALAEADRGEFFGGVRRAVWICPALELKDGGAAGEFLTGSDWPLKARWVGRVLSPAQEVMLLRRFCEIATCVVERGEGHGEKFDRLLERVDDLLVHVPTSMIEERKERFRRSINASLPFACLRMYRDIAEDVYDELVEDERFRTRDAVAALRRLEHDEQLFGRG